MSKERKKSGGGKDRPAPAAPEAHPPLNTPFLAARERLKQLVKPPPSPPQKGPGAPAKRPAPPPAVLSVKQQQPTDEDLFRQEMWGVRPLQDRDRQATAAPGPPPHRLSEEAEVVAELADLVDGTGPWDIADSDEYIEGIAPGLDRRLLQRLRKGDYAVQGHLDLHGLTSEEAHQRVDRFVQESRVQSKRCVLIIHGRGINSKDQIPVLKQRMQVWLTRGRIARSVLCFSTARPADGGAGAVYVLLRR